MLANDLKTQRGPGSKTVPAAGASEDGYCLQSAKTILGSLAPSTRPQAAADQHCHQVREPARAHAHTHPGKAKGLLVFLRDSFTHLRNGRRSEESCVFDLISVSVRCFH